MGFDIKKIYVHKNRNIKKGRNGKLYRALYRALYRVLYRILYRTLYRASVGCKYPSVHLTIDPETNKPYKN
jgi:hypothetical protein